MPRAALLSIHARVEGTGPSTWEDRSLVQLWGPRFSAYVVAGARSRGLLAWEAPRRRRPPALRTGRRGTSARLPRRPNDDLRRGGSRARRAPQLAQVRGADRHGPDPLGRRPAADRLDGGAARHATRPWLDSSSRAGICTSSVPRRPPAFAQWAGITPAVGRAAYHALAGSLTPVRTPVGEAWILAADEATFRTAGRACRPGRGCSRAVTHISSFRERIASSWCPRPTVVGALWTPRVWPGGVLVGGELVGTWRRADRDIAIQPWRVLSPAERDLVQAEAESLPLPGEPARIQVHWSADATGRP